MNQPSPHPVEPCPIIELSGSPRERGRRYGELAVDRIQRGVDHYAAQLDANELGWPEIDEIVARFEPTIAAFDAGYIEEMRGIAEGSGIGFSAIVLLNARTEILKLAQRRRRGQPWPDDPDGCTGVVVMPEAAADGRLIHAINWDWKAECAQTSVILKITRDDGPNILTFTEAGALARIGFNSAGISITANYLECDRDYRQFGVPLALIRRKVLEQQHLALAMRAVYATAKSAANNMIVAQATGVALDFECAPDETFPLPPQQNLIVHANHFQSPVALSKLVDRGVQNTPDSLYRDIRVRSLLEPHLGAVTVDTVKQALFDDFQTPWSVCRPPRSSFTDNLTATVAMVIMRPGLGEMEVAMLPALNRIFTTYRLESAVAATKAAE